MGESRIKLKQYGLRKFLIRVAKAAVRRLGIISERFVVLKRDLKEKVTPIDPRIEIAVRELTLQDFEDADHFHFSEDKLSAFKKRFDSEGYISLGAFHREELAYFCWLSLSNFESSVDLDSTIILEKGEALLLDAFTHPDYRGLGIHTYMNAVRLNKLLDLGRQKALVLVLSENTPALKSQIRVGFAPDCLICYRKVFGKAFVKEKEIQ